MMQEIFFRKERFCAIFFYLCHIVYLWDFFVFVTSWCVDFGPVGFRDKFLKCGILKSFSSAVLRNFVEL